MASSRREAIQNKLLGILPAQDFEQLARSIEYVDLPKGRSQARTGQSIDYVYFLTAGIALVMPRTCEGNSTEAGILGFEGFVPTSAAAQVHLSPYDIEMQVAGEGYRLKYEVFRYLLNSNRNVAIILVRFMEAFTIQLAFTAVSNSLHSVTERLARWLLMFHDRVRGDGIEVTHEFMSLMLGVRRPSVTTALHRLEGDGYIRANRGAIVIRDRVALEEFARDAYGKPEQEYRHLMSLPLLAYD